MPASSTMVRLSFKCEKLVNKDTFGKSDPFIIVDLQEGVGKYSRIGTTEVISNNLNPVFTKLIDMEYVYEKKQRLRITVIDVDDFKNPPTEYIPNMDAGDLLGTAEVTLLELMGARSWTVTKPLSAQIKNKNYGTVTIMGLKLDDSVRDDDELAFKLNGLRLAAKDTCQWTPSSDPYFVISRLRPDIKEMCKSEVVTQNLNPEWEEQRVNLSNLCGGDLTQKVRIEVWDKDTVTADDRIGNAEFSVDKILLKQEVKLQDYKERATPIEVGVVKAREAIIYRTPTFVDYMAEDGVEVQLVVAVDFTESNGDPSQHDSLHRLPNAATGLDGDAAVPGLMVVRGPDWGGDDADGGLGGIGRILSDEGAGWVRVEWIHTSKVCSHKVGADGVFELCAYQPNRYQRALVDVASMLLPLDSDRTVKAFGFGARQPGTDKESACFPLNLKDPDVQELKGLLEAYEVAQKGLKLGVQGTFTAEVINRVVAMAKETVKSKPKKYYILLMLTDGDMSDEADTTDAVVAASELPVSIVVAGLARPGSDETFDAWMKIDEGSRKLVDGSGNLLVRDTASFLRLDEGGSPEQLVDGALSAFQSQLLRHFQLKNVRPTVWEKDALHNYHIMANKPPLVRK